MMSDEYGIAEMEEVMEFKREAIKLHFFESRNHEKKKDAKKA
ncbi:MAG: hypothetical protein AB1656_02340 [Candidatus Omnitrophota bacterium]